MSLRAHPVRLVLVFTAIFVAVLVFAERGRIRDLAYEWNRPALPSEEPRPTLLPTASMTTSPGASATPAPTSPASTVPTPRPSAAGVPAEINLDVPFMSQAPHKVWDYDHEEFCEEASVLMAVGYLTNDDAITNPDVAEQRLYDVKAWEMKTFGYFADTTAAETARIIKEKFGIAAVQLVNDPTVAQIKAALAQKKVVLVPAAGRMLPNPNFKSPGPLYHFLVLKGYTADGKFITNDAGTRLGADFIYTFDAVMNAMHDWNGGDVNNGAKVILIVG